VDERPEGGSDPSFSVVEQGMEAQDMEILRFL